MDEKKFREVYEKEGIDFLSSIRNCKSADELVVFLGKKGIGVELSEASKILIAVSSFRFGKLSDESLENTSGGAKEFINKIFSSLLD